MFRYTAGPQSVGSMLDIRRLRYFLTIVRCGSMTSASRELNVAQPALSHHICELERIVGFTLLERLPRGVRPTPGGLILVDHARLIIEHVARAERDIRAYATGNSRGNSIRLGLLPSWIASFGDQVMHLARSRFPDHKVQMLEVRNDEAERMIYRNEIDVATALDGDAQFPQPIHEEPLYLASSQPLPPSVRIEDLAGMDMILASAGHKFRRSIEHVAGQHGVTLKVVLEIDGHLTLKKAVEQGMGNTVISWNAIRRECTDGLLHSAPFVGPQLTRPVYLRRAVGFDIDMAAQIYDILHDTVTRLAVDDGHTLPAPSARAHTSPPLH